MVNNVVVDDTDTQYIAYSGASDWTLLTGSSRQWESTVHSTKTYGAEAAFQFLGSGFIIYDTIPAGSGTVFVDITIDGGSPTRVTRTSGSDNVYNDVLYQSPLLATDSSHTVIMTNRGHSTDASFQFDKVDLLALDADPTALPAPALGNGTPTTQAAGAATAAATAISTANSQSPALSTTSSPDSSPLGSTSANSQISSLDSISSGGIVISGTSLGQTVTFTRKITDAGQSTLVTSTSTVVINATGNLKQGRGSFSVGAIAGIAIGGLLILALFIAGCFILKRRRGRSHHMLEDNQLETRQTPRSTSVPTPYHTDPQLLLIPPSKGTISPQLINGPAVESTSALSSSDVDASLRAGSATRTETQLGVQNPSSIPPGLTVPQEGYESQRESNFEAPPAYQPQRGSAGGPRTLEPDPLLKFLDTPT